MPDHDLRNDQSKTLFTVVSIVLNNVDEVEATINSVLNQTFDDYEYIIVDGESTDGTKAIIDQYSDRISQQISEQDKGLYDAMNKGLGLANGEYITWINAGDCFASTDVLEKVAEKIREKPTDCLYGDHRLQFTDDSTLDVSASGDLPGLWKRMQFSHQSFFVRTEKARQFPFDTSYRIAGDYCMILRLYLHNATFAYVEKPLCVFRTGGMSDERRVLAVWERFIVNRKYNNTPKIYFGYAMYLTSAFLKQSAKRLISRGRYERIKRRANM